MGMLSREQLESIGFASLGKNVLISDKVSFYGASKISIGNNVRIDDFCVFSAGEGGIEIGDYIHIAIFCSFIGAGKITISDFVGISSKVSIYSISDDFSGKSLQNPMVPSEYKNVKVGPVFLGKHTLIGCGTVILPNVKLEQGVSVGALSLINKNCEEFGIYAGNPAKKIKERDRNFLNLERQFMSSLGKNT
jgi:acetyltransferase-like isoleucine patch superfamily enzyme